MKKKTRPGQRETLANLSLVFMCRMYYFHFGSVYTKYADIYSKNNEFKAYDTICMEELIASCLINTGFNFACGMVVLVSKINSYDRIYFREWPRF